MSTGRQASAPTIAEIAHQFGGFYESGAWRFPSPDLMQSFVIALQAAEDVAAASQPPGAATSKGGE